MGKFKRKKFYRINQNIIAREVRVVDDKGKQIGVLPLSEALSQAQKEDLDLVEVASSTDPPVCKIIDFKKFRYLENKKDRGQKIKKGTLKEIRLSPFIAENDLNSRIEKAKKFLKEKNSLKIVVVFRGRQLEKKEFGYQILNLFVRRLENQAHVQPETKLVGRQLIMIINPDEKASQKNQTKNQKVGQKKI